MIRLEVQESPVVFDRRLEIPLLVSDHAQEQDGLWVLLFGEDATTRRLGLLQATAAVVMRGHVGEGGNLRVGCAGVFGTQGKAW